MPSIRWWDNSSAMRKAYRVLLDAMRDTGKVALGRIVLRTKQFVVPFGHRSDGRSRTEFGCFRRHWSDRLGRTIARTLAAVDGFAQAAQASSGVDQYDIDQSEGEHTIRRMTVRPVPSPISIPAGSPPKFRVDARSPPGSGPTAIGTWCFSADMSAGWGGALLE